MQLVGCYFLYRKNQLDSLFECLFEWGSISLLGLYMENSIPPGLINLPDLSCLMDMQLAL